MRHGIASLLLWLAICAAAVSTAAAYGPPLLQPVLPGCATSVFYCMIPADGITVRGDGSLLVVAEYAGAVPQGVYIAHEGDECDLTDAYTTPGTPFDNPDGILLHPDGSVIVADDGISIIWVIPSAGAAPEVLTDQIPNPYDVLVAPVSFNGPAVDPGDLLVCANASGDPWTFGLYVIDPDTGITYHLAGWPDLHNGLIHAAFGPDGKLYAMENDDTRDGIRIVTISPQGEVTPVLHNYVINPGEKQTGPIAVHPVTGEIFFADQITGRVYRTLPDGSAVELVAEGASYISTTGLEFSPDGNALYVSDEGCWTVVKFTGFPLPPLHSLTASCSADPEVVWSGRSTQLTGALEDSLAHSLDMYWRDVVVFDPFLLGSLDGGTPGGVVVRGNYAYVQATGALTIYDISIPESPQLVGLCDTPAGYRFLALSGDYAYVAGTSVPAGDAVSLYIIDVSDPITPVLAATYGSFDHFRDVAVSGSHAYLACCVGSEWGVMVLDITDPVHPQEVGFCPTPPVGNGQQIVVSGGYAYLRTQEGLRILDISDPFAPVLVGSCPETGGGRPVAVAEPYACVGCWGPVYWGLVVVDISDPTAPVLVGVCSEVDYTENVTVSGDYAYPVGGSGFQVVDISTPTAPVRVGVCAISGNATGVAVSGDLAYVGASGGFSLIDVSDPTAPTQIGLRTTWGDASEVIISGRYAYVAAMNAGLRVIDMADPAGPVEVGTCSGWCIRHIALAGSYVFGATRPGGIVAIDVSDPTNPTEVGRWLSTDWCCPPRIAISGHYAYLAMLGEGGVMVIDISDPASPMPVAFCPTSGPHCGSEIAISGIVAYLSTWAGVDMLDISDPLHPEQIGMVPGALGPMPGAEWACDITVSGSCLFVASDRILQIFDISNPALPSLVTEVELPDSVTDVTVLGSRAYVSLYEDGRNALRVLDISDPAAPFLVGAYADGGSGWPEVNAAVSEDYLFFAGGGYGIYVFDQTAVPALPCGIFSPSPYVLDPVYTAPQNHGDQDLVILLQLTGTCDGDPSLTDTATCSLTVMRAGVMYPMDSQAQPAEEARVRMMLDLGSLEADRFAFSAEVTATALWPIL